MCGVAAAVRWPQAGAAAAAIRGDLAHRGVLDDPVLDAGAAALAVRRLPIVEAATGAQPAVSADGRLAVAMNGEIYNHRELAAELDGLGVRGAGGSDAETLANALQAWGVGALPRIRGMFAFVALDLAAGEHLAGRDAFGEKPLYLLERDGGVLFASEMAPLLAASPTGSVMLVPPGSIVTRGGVRRWWRPARRARLEQRADIDALDARLETAVRRCLPPGERAAVLFSGGIDSTLVAAYARRLGADPVLLFAGGPAAPDRPYAEAAAAALGLELRTAPLPGPEEYASALDEAVAATESFEPSVVRPAVAGLALARAARAAGARVVLTGEGADELFAGYRPLEIAFLEDEAAGQDLRRQCLELLNRSALQRLDRTLGRYALEGRSPFLDLDVADYALALGSHALLRSHAGGVQGKAPLRALFDRQTRALPAAIRDRAKSPLNEGCGLDVSQTVSDLAAAAAAAAGAGLRALQAEHPELDLRSPEEAFYLERLKARLDASRIPSLAGRLRLEAPSLRARAELAVYSV